jgi:hypothetical protein
MGSVLFCGQCNQVLFLAETPRPRRDGTGHAVFNATSESAQLCLTAPITSRKQSEKERVETQLDIPETLQETHSLLHRYASTPHQHDQRTNK